MEAQGKTMNLAVEPSFDPDSGLGTKGEYDAHFFPTALGKYTFHLTGTIKGQKIDESFTSGPDTFSEVEDPATVQFPNKVPTLEAVSTRLTQESQRTSEQIDAAQASADDGGVLREDHRVGGGDRGGARTGHGRRGSYATPRLTCAPAERSSSCWWPGRPRSSRPPRPRRTRC